MDFRYVALNGQGRTIKGSLEARDLAEAQRILRQQELRPIALDEARAATRSWRAGRTRIVRRDRIVLVRELATLLRSGVTLAEATESIAETHGDDAVGIAFRQLHTALRSGEPFSRVLAKADLGFPPYVHQLVSAGESTGKLAQALFSAADQLEYEDGIRREMINALIYPSVLVFSGLMATLLIFIVVVPRFAGMLTNTKADLPALSVVVLQTGLFVKAHLLAVGLIVVAAVSSAAIALGNPGTRAQMLEAVARLPLLSSWLRRTELGRWSGMLATLLENKVAIVRALELSQASVQLHSLRNTLEVIQRDTRAGIKLADSLSTHRLLDATGINLVRVGERSGELPGMLRTLSTMHINASRDLMKRFLLLLEPVAILVIGSFIGLIMVAIMLAITSINNIPL
jgi:general secretion pathway protein F